MATKKKEDEGFRYGAEVSERDDVPEGQTRYYAVVYGPGMPTGGDDTAFSGTSLYTDKSAAETEAAAWCRDRGYTAHPF